MSDLSRKIKLFWPNNRMSKFEEVKTPRQPLSTPSTSKKRKALYSRYAGTFFEYKFQYEIIQPRSEEKMLNKVSPKKTN